MKTPHIRERKIRAGFTLMEMMLVLGIIALLVAIGAVVNSSMLVTGEEVTTRARIQSLRTAVLQYKTTNRLYPEKLEDLVKPPAKASSKRPLVEENALRDPWGYAFQFRMPPKKGLDSYEIYSLGPDGKDGTNDDVYLN